MEKQFLPNGLVLNTTKGLVLVDSSWDNKLTKELMEMVEKEISEAHNGCHYYTCAR